MKNTAKKKIQKADEISELAMKGEDISVFFTNKGEMRSPIQRVNVDAFVKSRNPKILAL